MNTRIVDIHERIYTFVLEVLQIIKATSRSYSNQVLVD